MSQRRTVYLLRHAATGLEHVWLGQGDASLSDAGRRQAERLATALRDSGADALFSSDLARARETAAPLAGQLSLVPVFVSGLRERHFGAWEGLTWEEISARFPSEAEAYVNDWLHVAPPGGEPVDAMRRRVLAAWADIASAGWSRAVIVGHGGSNRMLLAEFLGMPLAHLFRINQDVAGLNRIELADGVPCICELNRACRPAP
jgi:broad specificity phosphatase PhoE